MKKIIAALLLAASSVVGAQETVNVTLPCFKADTIKQAMTNYGETALTIGKEKDGSLVYLMFVNNKTRTWTMMAFQPDMKYGCVIGAGVDFRFVNTGT